MYDKGLLPDVIAAPAKTYTLDPAGLISWLETKDQERRYDYMNCTGHCLLGQFMSACGVPWSGHSYLHLSSQHYHSAYLWIVVRTEPHTFGAALARARALQQT